MPKTTTKSKSRTSKSGLAKRKGFKFRWWMGVVIVAVVAIIGIAVVYYSNAATKVLTVYCKSGDCRRYYFNGSERQLVIGRDNNACWSGLSWSVRGFKDQCY